jgi:uncharacterized membrane protein
LSLFLALTALATLAWAALAAPWRKLGDVEAIAVFVAMIAALAVLRIADIALAPGISLHFLGAMLATLMFGWACAVLALAFATAAAALVDGQGMGMLLVEFAFGALVPVLAGWWLLAATRRWLPRNPFAFFLGAGFGGGAATLALAVLAKAAWLALAGSVPHAVLVANYVVPVPAMMFGEGFFTGGAAAILAAYRPRWIAMFDDGFYLHGSDDRHD